MIFVFGFCTFTVLLFGCFSRTLVQVVISGSSTFTCVRSTSTPSHEPIKVSIDSFWPIYTIYYRFWGPVCFDEELSTDNVENSFLDVVPKYLQLTISTRDFITKSSSKCLFITTFNEIYNGIRQLYYLWNPHTGIQLRALHMTFTKKKALCSNVYIELSGHI